MVMTSSVESPTDWQTYHRVSRTGTYGFLAALPLLLIYEALVVFANQDALSQVRVGAEVWLKQLFVLVGNAGMAVFGAAVIVVGVVIFWKERKKRIPLRVRYFVWIILESAVYAVLVAIIVSGLVGAILTAAATTTGLASIVVQAVEQMDLTLKLALSIGAGIYEELLFRVILVGGLYLLVRRIVPRRATAYAIAAVAGAVVFSFVHYIGPYGDVLTAGSFLFRFFFGLVLNLLFLLRGFGIAAWTHALYDVMLVVGLFG